MNHSRRSFLRHAASLLAAPIALFRGLKTNAASLPKVRPHAIAQPGLEYRAAHWFYEQNERILICGGGPTSFAIRDHEISATEAVLRGRVGREIHFPFLADTPRASDDLRWPQMPLEYGMASFRFDGKGTVNCKMVWAGNELETTIRECDPC